jgi:hypothetical protein
MVQAPENPCPPTGRWGSQAAEGHPAWARTTRAESDLSQRRGRSPPAGTEPRRGCVGRACWIEARREKFLPRGGRLPPGILTRDAEKAPGTACREAPRTGRAVFLHPALGQASRDACRRRRVHGSRCLPPGSILAFASRFARSSCVRPAPTLALSGPARASLTLRPACSLDRRPRPQPHRSAHVDAELRSSVDDECGLDLSAPRVRAHVRARQQRPCRRLQAREGACHLRAGIIAAGAAVSGSGGGSGSPRGSAAGNASCSGVGSNASNPLRIMRIHGLSECPRALARRQ